MFPHQLLWYSQLTNYYVHLQFIYYLQISPTQLHVGGDATPGQRVWQDCCSAWREGVGVGAIRGRIVPELI